MHAILPAADRHEIANTFAGLNATDDVRFFVDSVGGNYRENGLPDKCRGRVAVKALGGLIPRADDAVESLATPGGAVTDRMRGALTAARAHSGALPPLTPAVLLTVRSGAAGRFCLTVLLRTL